MNTQAEVPLCKFWLDGLVLLGAVAFGLISIFGDIYWWPGFHWFQRSGGVMVICSGYLAYLSLSRHYIKARNSIARGSWWETSKNQKFFDVSALVLSVVGTAVWAYGDFLF